MEQHCVSLFFVSYFQNVLDSKTPLLRSMDSLGERAVELCHRLGGMMSIESLQQQDLSKYFLIDKAYAALGQDLVLTGRSIPGTSTKRSISRRSLL